MDFLDRRPAYYRMRFGKWQRIPGRTALIFSFCSSVAHMSNRSGRHSNGNALMPASHFEQFRAFPVELTPVRVLHPLVFSKIEKGAPSRE